MITPTDKNRYLRILEAEWYKNVFYIYSDIVFATHDFF